MAGALEGIRVLDLTRILAGPYATMMLADLGAEVIKIEIPGKGDDTRGWGPPFVEGESTYFMSINRNKKSLTLDMKKLIVQSDVVAENFRPGTMEKLGFGYERIREINPRIVYASVSGFGHTGPLAKRPGYDVVVQGEGGVMSLTGTPDGPPTKVGVSVADITAGMLAAHGILAALVARERTGTGQKVDIGMLDGQVALLTYQAGIFFATGKAPKRRGNAHPSIVPYETFACADGFINLGVGNDSLWEKFCEVTGQGELAHDPRFVKNADRVQHHDELKAILDEMFAAHPRDYWLEKLDDAGIPCGSINTLDQVLTHPQVLAREMVVEVNHPVAGPTKLTGAPIKLSETPTEVRTPPPLLGEHTEEILSGVLGLASSDIKGLQAEKVV
jgi:crotonobetainyl-CoA:carnitine CoA-transferase CaiB-like acyl-CoA transferase